MDENIFHSNDEITKCIRIFGKRIIRNVNVYADKLEGDKSISDGGCTRTRLGGIQ